ncbi:MAG: tRNA lysidine(34) synthetase TilS [Alkalispirochaeta sp.]
MSIPDLIQEALHREGVTADDLLVVAVSGGADSVSLAAAVRAAGFRRIHLAWVNHNLRADHDLARDAAVVNALGVRLQAPVLAEELPRGRVMSQARSAGHSVEHVARRLRYEALLRIAGERVGGGATCKGADGSTVPTVYLLTAHHRDDQTETVLSRIADGHPATAPLAIPARRVMADKPVRIVLLRPALAVEGGALRRWGMQRGLPWAEDHTNQDVTFRRNAIRHRVIPPLSEVLPAGPRMLARFGASHDTLLDAVRYLIPADAWGTRTPSAWSVTRRAFAALPEAAQEVVLRQAAYEVSISDRIDAGFIGEALRQLRRDGEEANRIEISGMDLVCVTTATTIRMSRDIVPRGQRGYLFPVLPGSVVTLSEDEDGILPIRASEPLNIEEFCVVCTSITFPAVLRDHRAGDAMVWKGHHRTVTEIARRMGIPRGSRRGAAVVEGMHGLEVIFWRGQRWAMRDGGTWMDQCTGSEASAAIFQIRG